MLTKRQKQILDYIKQYIQKKGYSPSLEEIGRRFKVGKSTVHQHVEAIKEKGYLNKQKNQSRAINVLDQSPMVKIPILGTIAAGQPIEAIQYRQETIAFPKERLPRNKNIYALQVAGNSMVDENINDGDIVVVQEQSIVENGQKVVALIDNQEATLKRFYKERGQIRLQPANKTLVPIIIQKDREFAIQGVVIDILKNEEQLQEEKTPQKEIKKYKTLPLNKIYNENCLDTMAKMPNNFVHITITSPPYDNIRKYSGKTFCEFELIAQELYRVTKEGGVVVWVVGDQTIKGDETGTSFRQALCFKQVGFNLFDTMIYLKTPRGAVGNNKTYWQAFEYMFILSKGTPKTINLIKDRENKDERSGDNGTKRLYDGSLLKQKRAGYSKYGRRTNVWEYLIGKGHSASDKIAYEHPAIFPEKLAQDHIISWSNKGDIVYDPFMGSGTTAKMAIINNRKYIGSEISNKYCEIAQKRIKNL